MFIEVLRRESFAYSSIWGEEIVRYSFHLPGVDRRRRCRAGARAHIRIDVIMQYVGVSG